MAEGALEEGVAEKTEGEDGEGEGVAGELGAVVEEVGEGFVVVFWPTFRRAVVGVVWVRGQMIPRRATMLLSECQKELMMKLYKATHFQNVGLNAMERAETAGRQLAIGFIY